MTRRNLVTDPSFKFGDLHWIPLNDAVLTLKSDGGYYGDSYLSVAKSNVGGSGLKTRTPISVASVYENQPFAASVYVRVPIIESDAANLLLKLVWYTASGSVIKEDTSELLTVEADGEWVRETLIGSMPVGAASVDLSVTQLVPGTFGKRFDIDAVLLEQSTYVGGYLDNISQDEENYLVNKALSVKPDADNFNGMDLNADVILGDLVFNTIDENGVVWVCTDIEGWWGQAEPEIPDIPRGVEDGSYDITGRYKARVLTLRGVFLPQEINQIPAARDALIAASNLVRDGVWLRTNEEPTRAAFVRLGGRPQITTVNARGRTEFAIPLKAADPIKYKWNDSTLDGFESVDIPRLDIPTSGTDVFSVISRRATTTQCTITTATSHGYAVGQTVVVSDVSPRYNGTFKILEVTADTITYQAIGQEEVPTVTTGTVVNKSQVTVQNEGTADVTVQFTVTGPIGSGSTITNSTTGEVLTIVKQLRGSGPIAVVNKSELFDNVATLTTISPHRLIVGDIIEVYGLGEPFDTTETVVKSITTTPPYTLSFDVVSEDVPASNENGGVSLKNNDVMTISTYDRSVTYNGDIVGHRSKVDTLTDWIKLAPGPNVITFDDDVDPFTVVYKDFDDLTGFATLTTSEAHFLVAGVQLDIRLAEEATLLRKELYENVVTLTTTAPHGFSVGDSIDVVSTEISTIVNKQLIDDVATLTTQTENGINIGDTVVVALDTTSDILSKQSTANVVTLQTTLAHGASVGDAIRVALPTTAQIAGKSLITGIATISTVNPHNYSVGDTITVTLPTTAAITEKYIAGETVVLTTAAAHGFSVNDRIGIILPTVAFPIAASYLGGSTNRVTITTAAAHGFIPGDVISVNLDVAPVVTVTNKSATSTSCTVTTSSTHNFSVGEEIVVSGVGVRYDGTFIISNVDQSARTVTYLNPGSSEGTSTSTGSITNNTIRDGYNGTKVVESVTTTAPHTLTYYYYGQDGNVANSIIGGSPSLTNVTNSSIDGVISINSVPASNQFSYTKVS